jgi:Leucine-rich repeat (LRR) protein
VEAEQLVECIYRNYHHIFYNSSSCKVEDVDLSKKTSNEKFSFSVSPERKKIVLLFEFDGIGRVAHVPGNVVEEFPNMTQFHIMRSAIPIVKNGLLGPQFGQIKSLDLRRNQIKIIEDQAFQHLHNLERIFLFQNKIQSLSEEIFKNNPKLKWISLEDNNIKMVAPETFRNLNQLLHVELMGNMCCKNDIGCLGCNRKLDHTELNRELQNCYENHKKSSDLLNEGEIFFIKIITLEIWVAQLETQYLLNQKRCHRVFYID